VIDRRTLVFGIVLAGIAGALLAAPLASAQNPMRKIGFLCPGSCTNIPHPFNEAGRALGLTLPPSLLLRRIR
jgi:hypothetical protein